jgi:hypothetical protein
MKQRISNYFKWLRGFFPSKLPSGTAEFHKWAQDIIDVYKPAADDVSIKFALCAMIMRLGPTESSKAKQYFAQALHKGAAAQVACAVMEDIKAEQRQATAAQPAEVTATVVAVTDAQTPTQAS